MYRNISISVSYIIPKDYPMTKNYSYKLSCQKTYTYNYLIDTRHTYIFLHTQNIKNNKKS